MRVPRIRGPVLGAALALTAVAGSAAASAALSEPPEPPPAQRMRDEIDDMIAAGVPEDDPKVEMLEEAVEELEGADASPPRDPGAADVADQIAAAEAGRGAGARPGGPTWQSGPVLCEVVPGHLDADEIAGAACATVPQPDGTARYVAVSPNGTVHSVLFAGNGQVRRLDDVRAGAPVPPGSSTGATPAGHLTITPPGRPQLTVDLP